MLNSSNPARREFFRKMGPVTYRKLREAIAEREDGSYSIRDLATNYATALGFMGDLFDEHFQDGRTMRENFEREFFRAAAEDWSDEQSNSSDARNDERREISNKIFVVHGRNEGVKHQAARTLEKLGLEPIVLQEQPNRGKTIVEKFEDAAESAGFAVVLLTGDDEGRLQGDESEPKPRARQNVILELGYLSARLGRRRVCALVEDGVEAPSDYDGVVYIPLDDHGAWRLSLAKELRAAGYDADANKLM